MAAERASAASELLYVCFPGLREGGATMVTDVADIWLHVKIASSDAHSGLIAMETEATDVALAQCCSCICLVFELMGSKSPNLATDQ